MATTFLLTGSNEKLRQKEINNLNSGVGAGNILDDRAEKKGINEVKAWQVWLNSTNGSRKTLIVRNAELLTPEAQNAFLKTLEEPPEGTAVILETENSSSLLPTVLSRCQIIDTGNSNREFTDKQILDLDFKLKVLSTGIGPKFALAQKVAKDRETALAWLDEMIQFLHGRTLAGEDYSQKLRSLVKAKSQLSSNTNVRLTLENLFLKW